MKPDSQRYAYTTAGIGHALNILTVPIAAVLGSIVSFGGDFSSRHRAFGLSILFLPVAPLISTIFLIIRIKKLTADDKKSISKFPKFLMYFALVMAIALSVLAIGITAIVGIAPSLNSQ